MKTIYKYTLQPGVSEAFVPAGAEFLSVQYQPSVEATIDTLVAPAAVWFMLDDEQPPELRRFVTLATGKPIPEDDNFTLRFLGTVQNMEGRIVQHVFEVVAANGHGG